ncbi:uncharacterized protein mi [Anabrus simplex]|uniref:uncharacterized protein mi n=1 Tax=Anabrus simplex TaxID=316456 RepID=UPI0035A2F99C
MLVTNDVLPDLSLKSDSSIGLHSERMILSVKSEDVMVSGGSDTKSFAPTGPVSSSVDCTVEFFAKDSLLEPKSENEMRISAADEGKMCMMKTPITGNAFFDQAGRICASYETTVKTGSSIVHECSPSAVHDESQNKFIAANIAEAIVSENALDSSAFDRKVSKELNEVSKFNMKCRTDIENTACTGNSETVDEHVPLYNADYCVNSPLLFASDDDGDDYDESINGEIDGQREEFPSVSADIVKVATFERLRLNRLRELLTGVLPPPSVTVPQHKVSDMLHLVKENHILMSPLPGFKDANAGNDCNVSNLKSGSMVQEIISCEWPRVRTCQYFDVQYNNGTVSEEYEYLCQKLQQRYVGCETASSCNLWFSSSSESSSGNARKRKSVGHSPGRRLSHLARRRRAFSSSSLQNNVAGKLTGNLQSQAPERRMIMVEIKKNESRKSRHLLINKDAINHKVSHSKVLSSKRALFQSPTEMKKPVSSASQSITKCKSEIDRPKIRHSRRALFSDGSCLNTDTNDTVVNLNGKRLRSEDDITSSCRLLPNGVRCEGSWKSVDVKNQSGHTSSHISGSVHSSLNHQTTASCKRGSKDLSANHKKKLLWAVAEALKKEGIGITHPSFRHCASSLASLCRRHLLDLLEPRSVHQDRGSTSDRMLKLATEFVTNVVSRFTLKENVS